MSESRFQRLQRLFDEALSLPPAQRPAFLREACGGDDALREEILSLLTHADEDDDSHLTLSARVLPMAEAVIGGAGVQHEAGQQIGHYRLIREIGSGGMGSVYLAERDDAQFRHQVALKLVRGFPTAPVLERFKRERELLATLRHPNIARLFDGGTTESGQPYLVMEYVDGVPLDAWCRREQPSLPARLKLFQSLCSAVQHAHQNLIVHRDLKPANVLVRSDGEPVLLDFGIGKLLGEGENEREATQLRALTPAYASPEQLRGEAVTTLADIYGLGLILFELLAGAPLRKNSGETTRLSASQVAARGEDWLRREARTLRGDLDNIVRKALREEPERRYPTAAALSVDIDAWFQGRPVAAVPDAWSYRVRKLLARHPLAIGATVATIVVLALMSWQLALERDRALAAQAQARLEAEGANQSAGFLVDLFKRAAPETTQGRELTVRALIDGAREELGTREFSRPEVKARLETALGEIYSSLGLPDATIALVEPAVDRLRAESAGDRLVLARALKVLGAGYNESGRDEQAVAVLEESLALYRALREPGHPEIGGVLESLGVAEGNLGRIDAASAHFAESAEIFRAAGEEYVGHYGNALHNFGWMALQRGDNAQAKAQLSEALALKERSYGADHPSTLGTLGSLAVAERALGDYDGAVARLNRLLETQIRVLGQPSRHVVLTHNDLGSTFQDAGRFADAQRHYQAAIAQYEQLTPEGSFELAIPINNLGTLLEDAEHYGEAEALYRRSLALRETHGQPPPGIARARHNLARALMQLARPADARALADSALALRREHLPEGHGDRLDSLLLRARIAVREGDTDAAQTWLGEAEREAGAQPWPPAQATRRSEALAELADARGDRAAAIEHRREQLAAMTASLPDDNMQLARTRLLLAELLWQQGEADDARALTARAAAVIDAGHLDGGGPSLRRLAALRSQMSGPDAAAAAD